MNNKAVQVLLFLMQEFQSSGGLTDLVMKILCLL